LRVSLVEDLLNEPLPAGTNILVEYDPTSLWYPASLSIAAEWLRTGGRVTYHVATQSPDNIRSQFKRLGSDVGEHESSGKLRIFDWYTATLGQKSRETYAFQSLKVADLSILFSKYLMIRPGVIHADSSDWLRILDDASCLDRFNDERAWVEFMLTRIIPVASLWKSTGITAVIRKVHSEWVYKRLEAGFDGVVDFKLSEKAGESMNMMRIRSMRNMPVDPRWYQLRIGSNFEVTVQK